uniref:Uncharacterized protein n=1 Tax=Naja naja TaxID=35670 RepID=A0A8C6XTA6_NAJNA
RFSCWKQGWTLLVVGALSASGHCAPSQKVLTYAEAVEQGVVNYNKKAKEDSLYRLLEAVPRPGWVGTLHFRSMDRERTQQLNPTTLVSFTPSVHGEVDARRWGLIQALSYGKQDGVSMESVLGDGFTLSMFLFLYRWSENAQPPISFGRRHLWLFWTV